MNSNLTATQWVAVELQEIGLLERQGQIAEIENEKINLHEIGREIGSDLSPSIDKLDQDLVELEETYHRPRVSPGAKENKMFKMFEKKMCVGNVCGRWKIAACKLRARWTRTLAAQTVATPTPRKRWRSLLRYSTMSNISPTPRARPATS